MPIQLNRRELPALAWSLLRWCFLGAWVGIVSGCASALFLTALTWATGFRVLHPGLLWGLPLAGIGIGAIYQRWGKSVAGGNNLLLERVHHPNETIPFRMAPLILLTTVGTHLFGGSAGREGTAVQMGGTLANLATSPLRLPPQDHRILIMSGISGGFGSVFGTPLAGTVFGMEVLSVGRIRYDALVPCFVASLVGDMVCRAWGVTHPVYTVGAAPSLTPRLLLLILLAGALFGGASMLFAELTDAVHRLAGRMVKIAWLRPALGGAALIALTALVGTRDYLGLSLPLIERSFTPEGVVLGAFALKLVFTAVTLGTGFKGGEVTPLFCIGATLGAAFARLTGQPTAFFAALGFVAVFAGAANTPIACALMGIELFGAPLAVPLMAACIVSYTLSGHRGIYLSQQVDTPKSDSVIVPHGAVLREMRAGAMEVSPTRLDLLLAPLRAGRPGKRKESSFVKRESPLTSTPFGTLRIFMRAGERAKPRGWRDRLLAVPVYQQILEEARNFGLPHGTAKQCVLGFLDERQIHANGVEHDNGMLPLYVELLGTREALEGFCVHAAGLLRGRTILFQEVEGWSWGEGAAEMTMAEVAAEIDAAGAS